jgi:hypothetical protein
MCDYRSGKAVMEPPAGLRRFLPQDEEDEEDREEEEIAEIKVTYSDPIKYVIRELVSLRCFVYANIDEETEILNYLDHCLEQIHDYLY